MIPAILPLLAIIGCSETHDPVTEAFRTLPQDPVAALEICQQEPFPQMVVPCLVQVAALASRKGDLPTAEAACSAVEDGTWRWECYFRMAEELSRGGDAAEAVEHCLLAGRFARFCTTHAAWFLPRDPSMDSSGSPSRVLDTLLSHYREIERLLSGAPDGLEGEGRDIFLSRLWFNLYFGSGVADPGPASLAPDYQAPYARGAFALEALRLHGGSDAVDYVLSVWRGDIPPPRGPPLPEAERHGRYNSPIPAPTEALMQKIPTYGGVMRLVGRDQAEDLTVAALEAMYFQPDTPADLFLPWLEDGRDSVRWTAVRLLRLCAPDELDMEDTLRELAKASDAGIRWHALDALEHRTWERQPEAYR